MFTDVLKGYNGLLEGIALYDKEIEELNNQISAIENIKKSLLGRKKEYEKLFDSIEKNADLIVELDRKTQEENLIPKQKKQKRKKIRKDISDDAGLSFDKTEEE